MRSSSSINDVRAHWCALPRRIRSAIRGLDERDLDLRADAAGWSIREYVHHLVESNFIAGGMVLMALATDSGHYDWTWVNPDRKWMRRLGYDKAAIAPAIGLHSALCRHVSSLLEGREQLMARTVTLRDAPGAKQYTRTIEQVLQQEVDHAKEHLAEVRSIRQVRLR